jgi:hypothetical protein
MSASSLTEDLLLAGLDDWVHFHQVVWYVKQREGDVPRAEQIAAAMSAIRTLVTDGLIQVGEVRRENGFLPWQGTIDEIVDRVRERWETLHRDPLPGDVAWLANTELGDRAAKALEG